MSQTKTLQLRPTLLALAIAAGFPAIAQTNAEVLNSPTFIYNNAQNRSGFQFLNAVGDAATTTRTWAPR